MPEYLSPGVYVEEIDAGPKPIAPVATSTAGIVGLTRRGPNTPHLITNYGEFLRLYGGPLDLPDDATRGSWEDDGYWWHAAESVKAFFDEGGARAFFQRVEPGGSVAASRKLAGGLVAMVDADIARGATSIRLSHTFVVATGDNLDVVNEEGTVLGTVTIASIDHRTRTVTLAAATTFDARRGEALLTISTIDASLDVLTVEASSAGTWGDALSVRILPVVGATLDLGATSASGPPVGTSMTVDAAVGDTTVTVSTTSGLDATTAVPFWVRIGGVITTVTNGAAAGSDLTLTLATGLAKDLAVGSPVQFLRAAAAGAVVSLAGAARLYPGALVQLGGEPAERFTVVSVDERAVTLSGVPTGTYVEGHTLSVLEGELTVRYRPPNGEDEIERFSGLRMTNDNHPDTLVRRVNAQSRFVRVDTGADFDAADPASFPALTIGAWAALGGGDDAIASLTVNDFVGQNLGPGQRSGIQALEEIDQVAICFVPGMWSVDVRSALIVHCETLADRFAVLDPPPQLGVQGIEEFRSPIDTKFAALYYPWVVIRNPRPGGAEMSAPPSGFVAGVYARVDGARGVWKAPANEVLRSIRGFEQAITKREQDILNPQNINVLRAFPGRGNRIWGARVLTSDPAWRYVSVRRLFLMLEESIDEATQWVVFEPNAEPLWARIRQSVNGFLTSQWRIGALQGTTAAEAFFVACDRSTMTQEDIDSGRLIVVVGIAPVKPAEFAIFRIQQKTLEIVPA